LAQVRVVQDRCCVRVLMLPLRLSGKYSLSHAVTSLSSWKICYIPASRRNFAIGENQELHRKVDELQEKVDRLTRLIEKQGARNLVERYNMDHPEEKATMKTFRPTLEMIKDPTTRACQLDNQTLSDRASRGDHFARRERMLREIMHQDQCSWDDAHEKLIEMDEYNEKPYWFYSMPYRIGIVLSLLAASGSCVMVFQGDVALWYAEAVVGETLPEGTDDVQKLTTNQIGSWTWDWMEPMIGVASFVLLCLQFARGQSLKLNLHPYTEAVMLMRGRRMVEKYPHYDAAVVRSWSQHVPPVKWNFMPMYRRELLTKENRVHNYRGGL